MVTLESTSELAWRQLFPQPNDETAITKEEFIETARSEFAFLMWRKIKEDKRDYGECEIPSWLLTETDPPLEVVDNTIDISDLKIMRGIDQELWLQNVGSVDCECRYVKSTLNHTQLLCDDDSLGDGARTYYVVGKKIIFPQGTHKNSLSIIYANSGESIDKETIIDDAIAGILRRSLVDIYAGRTGAEDKTNNTNPNV